MKNKSVKMIMEEYDEKYGNIPLDHNDILQYLLDKYPKIDLEFIEEEIKRIESIPWEVEDHVIPIIPKPAARPRYSFETKHFYVPGAASNKSVMKKILGISDNLILARTRIHLETYQPTPVYKMNKNQVYLAELGYIRPVIDPDFDNFTKAYMDAIQGVLLADDNIITDAQIYKFFSVKPRVRIRIEYMTDFDSSYTEKILTERAHKMTDL